MVHGIQGYYYELAFVVAPRHSFVNTTLELLVVLKQTFYAQTYRGL